MAGGATMTATVPDGEAERRLLALKNLGDLDELAGVYAQAHAYADELRRLYVERRATEAELAQKVLELERSHQQLLAYAADLGSLNGLLRATYRQTLEALGRAVDRRDGMTGSHCVRVAEYSRILGLRIIGARPQELQTLEYGAAARYRQDRRT